MRAHARDDLTGKLLLTAMVCGGVGCGVANAPTPDAPPLAADARSAAPAVEPTAPHPPPVPWPMGWCVGWTDELTDGPATERVEPRDLSHLVNGRVMLSGAGVPPAPCAYVTKYAANLDEDSLPDPTWMQVHERESGRELVVAVAFSGAVVPQKAGANVIVEDTLRRGNPPEGHLYVRDGSGAPLLWISAADTLENLREPQGIALERGESVASSQWSCGLWSASDMVVVEGGQRHPLPYGDRVAVGDHTLFHGGLVRDVLTDRCVDATAASAWLGVVWAPPLPSEPEAKEGAKTGQPARP